ncbi:hypothetical protein MIMGU_mgv1a025344mg, partial [Erythranthe guttata]
MQMGGSNCNSVYMNLPYCLITCKNQRSSTNIDSLFDELVLEILVHLRAEDIFDAAMVVCRKWYRMIHTHNFIYSHLQNSAPGLLIHYGSITNRPTFVSMDVEGRIEISKTVYKFIEYCWSSCNGLTLLYSPMDYDGLCISNTVTKQLIELPKYRDTVYNYTGIAYAPASMEYKVVIISDSHDMYGTAPAALLGCVIATVGVDKSWRCVRIQHLSLESKELFKNVPLTTEGFLHWTSGEVGTTRMLTLNVETEVITEIRVPQRGCNNNGSGQELRYYLSNGRSLTMLVSRSKFSWDVWELKKPEIGEWTKIFHIDLEGQKGKFEHFAVPIIDLDPVPLTLQPVGWLNYYEGLVFQVCRPAEGCFVYKLGKQEIEILDFELICCYIKCVVHKNSLVGL